MIPALIEKWGENFEGEGECLRVKRMKTKWEPVPLKPEGFGLILNWPKPVSCLEYIIAHEMVHLLERHHNERFLAILSKHLPNWKHLKDELNRLPLDHSDWVFKPSFISQQLP